MLEGKKGKDILQKASGAFQVLVSITNTVQVECGGYERSCSSNADISIKRYKYHRTISLPFFKSRFYNIVVSTEFVGHIQLNMIILSDMRNE